jgi:BirA family biotin operon repressor/biotin-[acetyl-CoA-carboxylase] ligase
VGIGVNLFPPEGGFPPELADIAGAVFPARPQGLESRSRLAGAILDRFFGYYADIDRAPFFEAYRSRSFLLGREIEILERDQVRPATALDLDPDFSLRVREAGGRVRSLSSGEVRVKAKKG